MGLNSMSVLKSLLNIFAPSDRQDPNVGLIFCWVKTQPHYPSLSYRLSDVYKEAFVYIPAFLTFLVGPNEPVWH